MQAERGGRFEAAAGRGTKTAMKTIIRRVCRLEERSGIGNPDAIEQTRRLIEELEAGRRRAAEARARVECDYRRPDEDDWESPTCPNAAAGVTLLKGLFGMHDFLTRKSFLRMAAGAVCAAGRAAETSWREVLDPEAFRHYIDEFNSKPVSHASDHNALSCALGHHIAEGRWLHDPRFVEEDIHFWLRTGENGGIRKNLRQFSGWTASAVYDRWLVQGDRAALAGYLDQLILDYQAWESERLTSSGLFWQRDVFDGMEESASGGRGVKNIRPSINSYMYGNAAAIAAIAAMASKEAVAQEYRQRAAGLKELIQSRLWNSGAGFFETRDESGEFAPVRESIGFTPWYFDLPNDRSGYETAWKQLMDPEGFYAPFGPTTVERRSPQFKLAYEGDDSQWNGPAWPFATTIALRALANVLNRYHQNAIGKEDYFRALLVYTGSQHRKLDDGRAIPWIDEDQNPLTGEWLARARKIRKPGFYDRGAFYTHSGYADLVITGLVGLRPRPDNVVEVNPLPPEGRWDWFCLDHVLYHGQTLSIIWDKTGKKFDKGKGLAVFSGAKEFARSAGLARVTGRLA
jgi:hypothetical protein